MNNENKTINNLLKDLDTFIDHEININNHYAVNYLYFEIIRKLYNIKKYNISSSLDYEKIAKIIAYAQDIIYGYIQVKNSNNINLLELLPQELVTCHTPYKKFQDIDNVKIEGKETFDAHNELLDSQNKILSIYVHATSSINILEAQKEIFFRADFNNNCRNIYIISDEIEKEHISKYFNLNNTSKENIKEYLEIIRLIILSVKVFNKKQHTKNKTLKYFFNTIFFSSSGFENSFNKKIFQIYSNEFFCIENLFFSTRKNDISDKDLINYILEVICFFADNLKFDYLLIDNGILSDKMKITFEYLYEIILTFNFRDSKILILKENILKLTEQYDLTLKKHKSFINKYSSIYAYLLFKYGIRKLSTTHFEELKDDNLTSEIKYSIFKKELTKCYMIDFNISEKTQKNKYDCIKDNEFITLIIYNFFSSINCALYKNKKKEEKNEKFSLLTRIINILDNLSTSDLNNIKIINNNINQLIYSNLNFHSYLTTLSSYFLRVNLNKEDAQIYLEQFKCLLLYLIFYPQNLKVEYYPNTIGCLLKYKYSPTKTPSELIILINLYRKYFHKKNQPWKFLEKIRDTLFLNQLDIYNMYIILKNKDKLSNLMKTLEISLSERNDWNERDFCLYDKIKFPYQKLKNSESLSLLHLNMLDFDYFYNLYKSGEPTFNLPIYMITKNKSIIESAKDMLVQQNRSTQLKEVEEYLWMCFFHRKINQITDACKTIYLILHKDKCIGFLELKKNNFNENYKLNSQFKENYNKLQVKYEKFIEIDFIFIQENMRKKGFGSNIIKEILNEHDEDFFIEVNKEDSISIKLLTKIGFIMDINPELIDTVVYKHNKLFKMNK